MGSFFPNGKIPLIGVNAQDLINPLAEAGASYVKGQAGQALSQVFQGSGRSFLGSAGQTLVTTVGQNILNVGLKAILRDNIQSISGVDLSSGQTILASVITPSITSALSDSVNSSISTALKSAGPFGPVLSQVATTAAGGLLNSITGALGLGGGAAAAGGEAAKEADTGPSRRFPGAGEEPKADYDDGGVYSLGSGGPDVVFSLQPANVGTQLFGLVQQTNIPKSATTQAVNQLSNVTNNTGAAFKADNNGKIQSMLPGATASQRDFTKVFAPDSKVGSPEQIAAAYGDGNSSAWTFICAPEDITWDLANAANRVDMFGTNNPPVVAGTKGMRNLNINNAVVEGFTRGVTVEYKIEALENLLNYSLNASDGFVSIPVYQFWANKKQYGGTSPQEGGYFIIKDVKVSEKMRDLKGYTTRATVDISLMQVPKYQVNSGRDQASKTTGGVASRYISQQDQNNINAARNGPAQQAQGQTQGTGSGPSAPQNPGGATGQRPNAQPTIKPRNPLSPAALSILQHAPINQGQPQIHR